MKPKRNRGENKDKHTELQQKACVFSNACRTQIRKLFVRLDQNLSIDHLAKFSSR
jgi:hypothetical protein